MLGPVLLAPFCIHTKEQVRGYDTCRGGNKGLIGDGSFLQPRGSLENKEGKKKTKIVCRLARLKIMFSTSASISFLLESMNIPITCVPYLFHKHTIHSRRPDAIRTRNFYLLFSLFIYQIVMVDFFVSTCLGYRVTGYWVRQNSDVSVRVFRGEIDI